MAERRDSAPIVYLAASAIFILTAVGALWGIAFFVIIFNLPILHFLYFNESSGIAKELIYALVFGRGISSVILTSKEIAHLVEVRGIIISTFLIVIGCLFSLFWFWARGAFTHIMKNAWAMYAFYSIMFFSITASIVALFKFDLFFLYFHKSFFFNDWWLLNEDNILINIFPPEFVGFLFMLLLTLSAIFTIIVAVINVRLKRKH